MIAASVVDGFVDGFADGAVARGAPESPAPASAGLPGDPLLKLRRTNAEIAAAFNWRIPDWSPEAAVRQARIRRLLSGLLDYQEISRRTLEPTWCALSPTERHAFTDAFSALAGHAFLINLTRADARQNYQSESIAGAEARVVAEAVAHDGAGGSPRHIEYRLSLEGRQWLVTDVVVDGISLVESYRRQFSRLVKREGVGGLIARLQTRLAAEGTY